MLKTWCWIWGGEQINESEIEGKINAGTGTLALGSGNLPASTLTGFVDPQNQKWDLLPTSPLLNKGKVFPPFLSFPSFDLAGRPRIQGGAPDLGPFERN